MRIHAMRERLHVVHQPLSRLIVSATEGKRNNIALKRCDGLLTRLFLGSLKYHPDIHQYCRKEFHSKSGIATEEG